MVNGNHQPSNNFIRRHCRLISVIAFLIGQTVSGTMHEAISVNVASCFMGPQSQSNSCECWSSHQSSGKEWKYMLVTKRVITVGCVAFF